MSVDVVYDCPMGAAALKQVSQSQFSEGLDIMAARMSGSQSISDQFLNQSNPVAEFTSLDVGGFLTLFGATGSQVSDGSTVQVPYHKRISGGSFAGGTTNMLVKGVAANPVQLTPMSVHAPQSGACTAQGQAHFLSSDGITQPWAVAVNQTLSAQAFAALYGLGPIYLNGTLVPRQLGYTVHFGVGYSEKKHYDGAVHPTDIFIEELNPMIEFSQEDFDFLSTIAGGVLISSSLVCWMRKRASGGTYVSDATAAHIKFSFTAGFLHSQQVSASETKNGQQGVRALGRALTIANGVALP